MTFPTEIKEDFEKYTIRPESSPFPFSIPSQTSKEPFVSTSYVSVKDELVEKLSSLSSAFERAIEDVNTRMDSLENRVLLLESKLSDLFPEEETPEIKISEVPVKMSKREAKKAVIKLFEEKGELDYVEVVSKLGIDLKLAVEICEKLEKENKIGVVK